MVLSRRIALALLLAAMLLAPPVPTWTPALAATFSVGTTADAPHSLPVNGSCTSTLPGSPCTLRAAIQAANFLGGGPHTINLAAGSYVLTIVGLDESAAATGDLDVTSSIIVN